MKIALLSFAQFLVYLVVFLVGSFLNPLNLRWFLSHPTIESTRFFVPTGLLAMLALYGLILLIEVATKRPRMAVGSTVAVLLALVLGYLSKFGFVTQ